jgi:hypothetical protein
MLGVFINLKVRYQWKKNIINNYIKKDLNKILVHMQLNKIYNFPRGIKAFPRLRLLSLLLFLET